MTFNTYITIVFTIITTSVISTPLLKIITKKSSNIKADEKKYTKSLVLSTVLLIFFATLIYKYKIFRAFCSEMFICISECFPFFYNKLMRINWNDSQKFSFYALFDPQDDSQLFFLLSLFTVFIINFLSEFKIERKFWFEELSKILCIITVVIYLIIVTFLFILAYYILCNTYLHIISYILFLIILISLFQQRRILWIIRRIQSKITDY